MAYSKSIENMKSSVYDFLNRYIEINDSTLTPQVLADIKKINQVRNMTSNLKKYFFPMMKNIINSLMNKRKRNLK